MIIIICSVLVVTRRSWTLCGGSWTVTNWTMSRGWDVRLSCLTGGLQRSPNWKVFIPAFLKSIVIPQFILWVEYSNLSYPGPGNLKQSSAFLHHLQSSLHRDFRIFYVFVSSAQLRDIAYCTKAQVFKPDVADGGDADEFDAAVLLERGENLLEFQIVSASLSPSALEALGDSEPSTFCTYNCCLFGLHSTPVVTGQKPKYGYTSKCLVCTDEEFLEYLHSNSVTIELHQAIGTDWQTLATGRLQLQQLLEQDGKVHGTIPLIGEWEKMNP